MCVLLRTQEKNILFWLTGWLSVVDRLSKCLCVTSFCAFSLPDPWEFTPRKSTAQIICKYQPEAWTWPAKIWAQTQAFRGCILAFMLVISACRWGLLRHTHWRGTKRRLALQLLAQLLIRHRQEPPTSLGRTPTESCNNTLLKRVLRRLSNSKCFLEGFLEGACKGFSVKTRFSKRVLRRERFIGGASKVLRRQKHVLSQSTTPLCVHPHHSLSQDKPRKSVKRQKGP